MEGIVPALRAAGFVGVAGTEKDQEKEDEGESSQRDGKK